MNSTLEQQFEDILVRVFTRVFSNINYTANQPAAEPGPESAAPARRNRKTKEIAETTPAATAETKVEEAPASAPAAVAEPLKFERKNVTAVLVTIARSEILGSPKAYELLSKFGGAKEVKDLKDSDYQALITEGANMLNISVEDALKLDPSKG